MLSIFDGQNSLHWLVYRRSPLLLCGPLLTSADLEHTWLWYNLLNWQVLLMGKYMICYMLYRKYGNNGMGELQSHQMQLDACANDRELAIYTHTVIFSCDQAALWMVQSVCPSVCLSVCLSVTPFWLCSHHPIIMKFSGVITSDKSDVHAKGQGQRSRSQRSRPNLTVSGL